MERLPKNIVFKLLLAVCALAHLAAAMPHHHHGDDTVPCMTTAACIFHAVPDRHSHSTACVQNHFADVGDRGDGCCGATEDCCSHNPDSPGSSCSFDRIDIISAEKENPFDNVVLYSQLSYVDAGTDLLWRADVMSDSAAGPEDGIPVIPSAGFPDTEVCPRAPSCAC